MRRRHASPTREQKRRRIPKLPNYPIKLEGGPDRGAPLPKPQSGYEFRNLAGPFEAPNIVAVKKPDY